MLIGLDFGHCIRDIVLSKVNSKDVLVIMCQTDFDPGIDEKWGEVWLDQVYGGLKSAAWTGLGRMENELRVASLDLYLKGKLHQLGKYRAKLPISPYGFHWLETVFPKTFHDKNPVVKQAWDQYQLLLRLSTLQDDQNHKLV